MFPGFQASKTIWLPGWIYCTFASFRVSAFLSGTSTKKYFPQTLPNTQRPKWYLQWKKFNNIKWVYFMSLIWRIIPLYSFHPHNLNWIKDKYMLSIRSHFPGSTSSILLQNEIEQFFLLIWCMQEIVTLNTDLSYCVQVGMQMNTYLFYCLSQFVSKTKPYF